MSTDVYSRTLRIVQEMRAFYDGVVSPTSRVFTDLAMDSLDLMTLLSHLEREFEIELAPAEIELLGRLRSIPASDLDDGFLSESWLAPHRRYLVDAPARLTPEQLADLVTVEVIGRLMEYAIQSRKEVA